MFWRGLYKVVLIKISNKVTIYDIIVYKNFKKGDGLSQK